MRVVTIREPGGPDVLCLRDERDPQPGRGEVVLRVAAAGVNRADIMQRRGHYPSPPGAPTWPGLECSGWIVAVGPDVDGWGVGDQACALLSGGGYAEEVAVPAAQLLPVPAGVSLVDAAALPEVGCTVWSNVVMLARLCAGERLLVHGGSSGVGTMAIQVGVALGASVAVTAGSAAKLAACRSLGADVLVDYREQDFVAALREATGGRGADVVLDNMGAEYLARNVAALATGGRLVVVGLQGGTHADLDLGTLLAKRGAVHATSLRARPPSEKAAIVAEVRRRLWPLIERGRVRPVVHRRLPLEQAAAAHRLIEQSQHIGKVLLLVAAGMPTAQQAAGEHARHVSRGQAREDGCMTNGTGGADERRIVVVTPEAMAAARGHSPDDDREQQSPAALIGQPAKVMRIGSMIKQLLEEVRNAPLDEAGRVRLAEIHQRSIRELEDGLAPELIAELDRITLPFGDNRTPSDAELRIAQAQLVGWLEGLFHGIQTALFAQQMAARAQLQEMRRALPGAPGSLPDAPGQPMPGTVADGGTGQYL